MNKKGFTLVEILITVVVAAVIMAAVYGLMTMAQRTSSSTDRRVITQQDTRSVLHFMAMEIRMASFNTLYELNLWAGNGLDLPGIPTCWNVSDITNAHKGIQRATANELVFAMDLDGDGEFTSDNEYIRYHYDDATKKLSRAAMTDEACGEAQDILGGDGFTNIMEGNGGVPMFRYFSATNEMGGASGNSMDIRAIRRILITIVSETASKDSNTGNPKRMVHSTNVIVRNHVLSLPRIMQ